MTQSAVCTYCGLERKFCPHVRYRAIQGPASCHTTLAACWEEQPSQTPWQCQLGSENLPITQQRGSSPGHLNGTFHCHVLVMSKSYPEPDRLFSLNLVSPCMDIQVRTTVDYNRPREGTAFSFDTNTNPPCSTLRFPESVASPKAPSYPAIFLGRQALSYRSHHELAARLRQLHVPLQHASALKLPESVPSPRLASISRGLPSFSQTR